MIEEDEAFEPDCKKCRERYGFTELLPENYLTVEIYQSLNSSFVQNFKIQDIVWNRFKDEIEEEGFSKVLEKLNIITEIAAEFSQARGGGK
tara:strand:- start:865 stop:1137 length:273 start_codon:yes stop_codon:yes gene_type:complete